MDERAATAAQHLQDVIDIVKGGSLRMFGDWFGRPLDNLHVVRSADADGDDLIVRFDEDEVLTITQPGGWTFNETKFEVRTARRVLWRWYSYGQAKKAENLFTVEHWVDDDGTLRAYSDETSLRPTFSPSTDLPAAELL